jgi:hypothetical protein
MNPVPQKIMCKICGSSAYFLCDTPNTHGEIKTIHHYRCGTCGLVFVGNQITNEQLSRAYMTLETKKYYKEIEITEERKFVKSLADLQRYGINPYSNVIDIGKGNGAFLLFLKRMGFC